MLPRSGRWRNGGSGARNSAGQSRGGGRLLKNGFVIAVVAFFKVSVPDDLAMLDQGDPVAEFARQFFRVRRKNKNSGAVDERFKPLISPFEKRGIARADPFIQQQNVWLDTGRHRKC